MKISFYLSQEQWFIIFDDFFLLSAYEDAKKSYSELRFINPRSLRDVASKKCAIDLDSLSAMFGDINVEEPWGPCPMTMVQNYKRYIGTVSHGKARILQAKGSDVSLEIPKNSRGVYVMGVHTDFSNYHYVVASEECFVSPVVQVLCKSID